MKIVCFGDSNTYGYDPRSRCGEPYPPQDRWVDILRQKTGWEVINQGCNGREIPGQPEAFPADTGLLIVMLGTNDLLQFYPPDMAADNMRAFLESLTIAREKILLIAPPPMIPGQWVQDQGLMDDCRELTRLYRLLASDLAIRFADAGQWGVRLGYDGVHFTAEGHHAFAEGLYQEVTV